jgi:hypothetical protein
VLLSFMYRVKVTLLSLVLRKYVLRYSKYYFPSHFLYFFFFKNKRKEKNYKIDNYKIDFFIIIYDI